MTTFTTDVYQYEFLPADGTEVNAIVTVTASGGGEAGRQPPAAEVVIVDTSGSMDVPRSKIKAAREATSVAIDCIRDDVAFAVISGNHEAEVVYPGAKLVPASAKTRAEAKRAVGRLRSSGGTAIGQWLATALELFGERTDRVSHAILLTDGEDEHETRGQLDAVLARCESRFQCGCRGVGTVWDVGQLRRVC